MMRPDLARFLEVTSCRPWHSIPCRDLNTVTCSHYPSPPSSLSLSLSHAHVTPRHSRFRSLVHFLPNASSYSFSLSLFLFLLFFCTFSSWEPLSLPIILHHVVLYRWNCQLIYSTKITGGVYFVACCRGVKLGLIELGVRDWIETCTGQNWEQGGQGKAIFCKTAYLFWVVHESLSYASRQQVC